MRQRPIITLVVILSFLFAFLPFFVFKQNCVITIHDNLDQIVPYYKMFHDNGLFFSFDVPTKGFNGMSTLYYGFINYSFTTFLYYIFDCFYAYAINYCFSVIFAFISMLLLLKQVMKKITSIVVLVALTYSLLPVVQACGMGIGTIPFAMYAFLRINESKYNVIDYRVFFLLFFPLVSSFTYAGFFILGLWFCIGLGTFIHNKRIHKGLIVGFFVLLIGYILVDLRLFYVMFILRTPLNRAVFSVASDSSGSVFASLITFLRYFYYYFVHGFYHASTQQRFLVLPVVFIVSTFIFILSIRKMIHTRDHFVNSLRNLHIWIKLLFLVDFLIIFVAVIAAIYDAGILVSIINRFFPILKGFNWGRIWIFNRVFWYLQFALCLSILTDFQGIVNSILINDKLSSFIKKIPGVRGRSCAMLLCCLQLIIVISSEVAYNDAFSTWKARIQGAVRNVTKKETLTNEQVITYKEFFDSTLFDKLKKDIDYVDEKTLAFGFHPSVLMYNGFNCIDGYNNAYPLSYMVKFRSLIAPELETDDKSRKYFDEWGGRLYAFSDSLDYLPTWEQPSRSVSLKIDIGVFKNEFDGKYIISRARIDNAEELCLSSPRVYNGLGLYSVYLYTVK